jgi:hypothetical protein
MERVPGPSYCEKEPYSARVVISGRRLFLAGAVVAALDGLFAVVLNVVILHVCTTAQLFQAIASSVLGRAAFRSGTPAVLLGLLIHVGVAYAWTAAYALACSRWAGLRRFVTGASKAVTVGAGLGVLIWLAMDLIVVPLSRARPTPPLSTMFFILLAWHTVGVGMPTS